MNEKDLPTRQLFAVPGALRPYIYRWKKYRSGKSESGALRPYI